MGHAAYMRGSRAIAARVGAATAMGAALSALADLP